MIALWTPRYRCGSQGLFSSLTYENGFSCELSPAATRLSVSPAPIFGYHPVLAPNQSHGSELNQNDDC